MHRGENRAPLRPSGPGTHPRLSLWGDLPIPFSSCLFFFFLPGKSGTAAKLRDLTLSLPQREERSRQPPAPTGSGRPGGQWDGRLRLPGGGGGTGLSPRPLPWVKQPRFRG